MNSFADKIAMISDFLDNADSSVRSAKKLMNELTGAEIKDFQEARKLKKQNSNDGDNFIEGVFNGKTMEGKDNKEYPVPMNYASKSKLIPGDTLKLIITDTGSFVYKQIGPISRKRVVGILSYESGNYMVLVGTKTYNVLLASVTYFHAEPGNKVTLIIPETGDSKWGAIENVLPDEINNADIKKIENSTIEDIKIKEKKDSIDDDEDIS